MLLKRSAPQTSSGELPLASISLDLDNLWSYMKTHGDAGWESLPSYLDVVVPRILQLLDELDLKITFFIVGQDAAKRAVAIALRNRWRRQQLDEALREEVLPKNIRRMLQAY